jgi:hypothetical protein
VRRGEALTLFGIVAAGAIPAILLALSLTEFVVMPDELGYVKQATQLGRAELMLPSDLWFNSWSLLHPLLLAPFYHWFSSTSAFDLGHAAGAIVMASTAIPVYLLARRVLPSQLVAYLVALLSVAVPWLGMSGTMMTEVVAYPAFAWTVLASVHAAANPGPRSDLLLLASLAAAFLARTQLAALAPGAIAAILLHALVYREDGTPVRDRLTAAIRGHAVLLGAAALALLAIVIGGSTRFVGAYSTATKADAFKTQTLTFARESLAYVIVAIGAIPAVVATAWAVLVLARGRGGREIHAFAAVALVVGAEIALVGGAFTASFASGINDRYVFYVVPLLFVAMAAGLLHPVPGRRVAIGIAGAATTWLLAASALAQEGPSLVSPSMAWHTVISDTASKFGSGFGTPGLTAVATALLTIALVVLVGRVPAVPLAVATCLALLVFCGAETAYTYSKVADTQAGTSKDFVAHRGWLDRALPRGARAAIVLTSFGGRPATTADWWDTSFWNKTVTGIYRLAGADGYDTAFARDLGVDPATGRVPELDPYAYFVRGGLDGRLSLRGSTTAASSGGYLIVQAERPYRAEWLMSGGDPESSAVPAGREASVRAWRDPGAGSVHRVGVTLQASQDAAGPVAFSVRGPSGDPVPSTLKPGERATVELPASYDAEGHTDLKIAVDGSAPAPLYLVAIAQP